MALHARVSFRSILSRSACFTSLAAASCSSSLLAVSSCCGGWCGPSSESSRVSFFSTTDEQFLDHVLAVRVIHHANFRNLRNGVRPGSATAHSRQQQLTLCGYL